jgi:hypothetical protein
MTRTTLAFLALLAATAAVPAAAEDRFDPGYQDSRTWLDINGDRALDYCRIVGGNRNTAVACAVSKVSSSDGGTYVSYTNLQSNTSVDRGYEATGGFASPNVGVVAYCSGRGSDPKSIQLGCDYFRVMPKASEPMALERIEASAALKAAAAPAPAPAKKK